MVSRQQDVMFQGMVELATEGMPRPAEPAAPTVVIQPTRGLAALQPRALWEYRELLYFLVWRDVKVRYKQTALGVAWIVLQPGISTVVFTVLFGILLQVPSGGIPYPLFALAGLVPWNYFAGSLTRSSTSLVASSHLISKVYFPRLIIPISGVLAGLVDLAVTSSALVVLMFVYRIAPTWRVLLLPGFVLLAMATALGFGLWLSALNVRYRDVNYLVPFLVQVWMYLTPVVYGATLIPEQYRWLLALNPMTAVVEGFRWALLGSAGQLTQSAGWLLAVSVLMVAAVLAGGLFFFRSTERTFADVI
jgi:lipopolysaccharide transport system permease protein